MQLPEYDSSVVEPRALPGVRQESVATPGFMAGAAESFDTFSKGLQVAGSGLMAVATYMKKREDMSAVMKAEEATQKMQLDFENDIRANRRGEKAAGVGKDTAEWWDKTGKAVMNNLENDDQRELYRRRLMPARAAALRSAAAFEETHTRAAFVQQGKSTISMATNSAANNADPDNIAAQTQIIEDTNIGLARVDGWNATTLADETDKDISTMHARVVDSLAKKGDGAGAEAYIAKYGDQIKNAKIRADVTKIATDAMDRTTAQNFTEEMITSGKSQADALAEARKRFDGTREELAVQHIKVRYGEAAQQREAAQRDMADTAWQAFSKRGAVSDIPAGVWAAMDGRDKEAIRHAARTRASEGEILPKTDWGKYYDLRQEAMANPEAFAKRDLRRDFSYLGKAEREGLIDLQGRKPQEVQESVHLEAQLGNVHDLMKWGTSDKAKKGAFDAAVSQEVIAQEKATGKKLDYDSRQKIIDRMLIEGDTNGWAPFGDKRYFEMTPEERKNFTPKYAPGERAAIIEAIRLDKKNLTGDALEAEVVRRYRMKKGI